MKIHKGVQFIMNKKVINVLSTAALAFSLSAAPTSVFAQEDESTKDTTSTEGTTTVQMKDDWTLTGEEVTFEYGKLFSFLDTLTQNFKLALEQDDMEKAKLYADYGKKRIEEAKQLLEEGKDEEAAELLEQATKAMEKAEELSQEEDSEENNETDENSEDTDQEDSDEDESDDTEESDEESDEDDESDEDTDEEVEEDEDSEEDSDEDKSDEEEKAELDAKIGQNVISLKRAMDKVDNPNAKKALERNIEKALTRLEAKYGDIEVLKERLKEMEEDNEEDTSKEDEGTDSEESAEQDTEQKSENDQEESDEDAQEKEDKDEEAEEDESGIPSHAKEHKKAAKEHKQEMKEKKERLKDKKEWKKEVNKDDDKGHRGGNGKGKGNPHN